MAAPLDAVAAKLVSAGVASGSGTGVWPVFVGWVPDLPNQAIGLQATGGFPQDTHAGENLLPTFQVLVRAAEWEYAACNTKWSAMFAALQDATITGVYLIQAMASGPMSFVDAKNRMCMTVNFRMVIANT